MNPEIYIIHGGKGGWSNTSPPERLQERNRTSVSFAGLEGKFLSEFFLVASTALSVWFMFSKVLWMMMKFASIIKSMETIQALGTNSYFSFLCLVWVRGKAAPVLISSGEVCASILLMGGPFKKKEVRNKALTSILVLWTYLVACFVVFS